MVNNDSIKTSMLSTKNEFQELNQNEFETDT